MRLVARTPGCANIAHRFIIEKLSAFAIPTWQVENEEIKCTQGNLQNAGFVTLKSERNRLHFILRPITGNETEKNETLMCAAVFKMLISNFGDHVSQIYWCGESA